MVKMLFQLALAWAVLLLLSTWQAERGRVAALSRSREPDDPELLGAKAELRVLMVEKRIREVLDAEPPLNPDVRERLAAIVSGADR